MHYFLGNFSLILTMLISTAALGSNLLKNVQISKYGAYLNVALILLVSCAYFTLTHAYLVSEFALLNVFANSSLNKPLIYKFTGVWGNHEGSLLLFLWFMTLILFSKADGKDKYYLNYAWLVMAIFSCYIFFTSNPFWLNPHYVKEGQGLNPVLQDIGLAIHPPILYIAYALIAKIFCVVMAFSYQKNLENSAISLIKKLSFIAFMILSCAIVLGSWWAYRELGWGGYWFWDPVENLALLIWLALLMLLHSALAARYDKKFNNWLLALSLASFILLLLSFFLVRSGILLSVHSFSEAGRGIWLLAIFSFFAVLALNRYFASATWPEQPAKQTNLLSLSNLLRLNNYLVFCLVIIVLWGTLYPIIMQFFTQQKNFVTIAYFNKLTAPILNIMFLSMCILPYLKQLKNLKELRYKLAVLFLLYILAGSLFGFLLLSALLLIVVTLYEVSKKSAKNYVMHLAHFSVALFFLGIILNQNYRYEAEKVVTLAEPTDFNGFAVTLQNLEETIAQNYLLLRAQIEVSGKSGKFYLQPERRYYQVSEIFTKEAVIKRHYHSDIYIVLGEIYAKNKIKVRFIYNPYVNLLWLAALLMFIAMLVGLKRKDA